MTSTLALDLRRRIRLRSRIKNILSPPRRVTDAFHRLYYDSERSGRTWGGTYWFGTGVQKCPLDLWIYQEIIHELRPDLIIEAGTFQGGSALFLASLFDLIGHGEVVSIDIESRSDRPRHKRITYLLGSSTSDEILEQVKDLARCKDKVMVILDSDHTKNHVLRELELYSGLVSPGCYLIVEDTNLNGHPVAPSFGPGPMEALEAFIKDDRRFITDHSREKLLFTFNPRGYLRRLAE